MADPESRTQPSFVRTALWLGAFLILAFALRSVFSAQVSYHEESESWLQTGNDPYFHHITTTHVLETGQNLDGSKLINYPEGRDNPNPPLWTWTSAVVAVVLKSMNVGGPDFVGYALNLMVAVWGALCLIPIYMIAKDLWGRRAGLWAAFFMAISAPHIQRAIWGYGDHDAISMFFILLAFAFIVRGLKVADLREHVAHWNRGSAIASGLRDAVRRNRDTLLYATLAGLSVTACALTWKGYPYVFGIIALAAFLQLVLDHMRNRDSTVTWMVYTIVIALGAVLPWLLYYQSFPHQMLSTVYPSLYVLGGVVLLGLVLVPTRDLPSILVFPALAVAVVLGALYLMFLQPGVWGSIVTGLGYFQQSKLYSTIAEAQRPSLGQVAATLGFFTFLLAFWGFARTLRVGARGDGPNILVAAWAIVAMYMMFRAARFEVNAAPVFAVLLGYALDRIVSFMDPAAMRKRFRASHGQNPVTRPFRALSWKSSFIALGIAFLLVLPPAWLAVDAAMPFEYKQDCCAGMLDRTREVLTTRPDGSPEYGINYVNPPRLGALGISFDDIAGSEKWIEVMSALALRDTCRSDPVKVCAPTQADGQANPDYQPPEERPAFVAWWDYGHWAAAIGKHPTVADPFQSHHELAGRVLASDSEEEAIRWLTILLLQGDRRVNGGQFSAPVHDLLQRTNASLLSIGQGYRADLRILESATQGTDAADSSAKAFRLYDDVCAATETCVEYLGVSSRMYPAGGSAGIFYAPVYLADKNPDDYVTTRYYVDLKDGGNPRWITQHRYAMVNATGNACHDAATQACSSVELEKPRYTDDESPPGCTPLGDPADPLATSPPCKEYVEYQGYLYEAGKTPLQGFATETGGQLLPDSSDTRPTDNFYRTLFARAFPNTLAPGSLGAEGRDMGQPAGDGLRHWRAIEETVTDEVRDGQTLHFRGVVLLEYFRGVTVNGTLQDDAGNPMVGYTVTFRDGFGATHGQATTDDAGRYVLQAPFSEGGDLTFEVLGGAGRTVYNSTAAQFQFTRQQAKDGDRVTVDPVQVRRGDIAGLVYEEVNGNTTYEPGVDKPVAGADVFAVGAAGNKVKIGTTGEDGRFLTTGQLPNDYTVEAHKWPEYLNSTTKAVTVPSGGRGEVQIGLTVAPAQVTARFVDRSDQPVEGIPIVFSGPAPQVTATTNATGAAMAQLAPGTWSYTVNHTVTITPGTNETQAVTEHYSATGTITIARGQRTADLAIKQE